MADILRWQDTYENDPYALPESDPLGVLTGTHQIVELGERVWINLDQVEALSALWAEQDRKHPPSATTAWNEKYHFHDGVERSCNWVLVLDALNFCFWAEKDQPRWSIEYKGETLNGYWAEAAALKRAAEEGLPIWDAQYLSTINEQTVAHIFRGKETIPLFDQRVAHLQEVGRVLLEKFDGQFSHALEQAAGDAVQLALLLAREFPSFHDIALYRGHEIRFLKRAQICVADLATALQGDPLGTFTNIDQLTAFADYKLPQVLRHYKVLEYQTSLAQRIDRKELIAPGSEEELEIRSATIWACELLRRSLHNYARIVTNAEIDQRLWLLGQASGEMRPYHRTRTIYY